MSSFQRFAVIGHPIEHSLSPQIHQAFAEQLGDQVLYEKVCAPLDEFEPVCEAFFNQGGKGLNITVPFKERAFDWADLYTDRAKLAGAVNTLWKSSTGQIVGDNTDGVGLVTDLSKNLGFSIENKRILMIGAGGAVKGVLGPIIAQGPKQICISNRTEDKAQALSKLRPDLCIASSLSDIPSERFDLVVNGTSISLDQSVADKLLSGLPSSLIHHHTCYYDMMYSPKLTPFLSWCSSLGAQNVVDGLGMLVEQAAEAYFQWHDKRPDTAPVLANLRASLQELESSH